MVRALVLRPDAEPASVEVEDLADLWGLVGGYVEAVPLGDAAAGYIHEEGKWEALPPNLVATWLAGAMGPGLGEGDWIAGTMVVVGTRDRDGNYDGDEHDCPPEVERQCRLVWAGT